MPEISLRIVRKENDKLIAPEQMPKEVYPGFSVNENVPAELMNLKPGQELTAKIKVAKTEKHEGRGARKSIGFDVLAVVTGPEKKPEKKEEVA